MRLFNIIQPTEEERQWLAIECSSRAAMCFHEVGMFREAAECWFAAGEKARAAELYLERKAFSRAASLFLSEGRYGEALDCYEKCLELAGERDVEGRVKSLLGISACMRLRGDPDQEMRKIYQEARELIEQDERREPLMAGRVWEVLGRYGNVMGRGDLVCVGFEKALSFFGDGYPEERLRTARSYHRLMKSNRLLAEDIAVRIAGWSVDRDQEHASRPKPRYRLRSEPITVSEDECKVVFGLDENRRPLEYIENEYEDNGDGTITDHATGLTWQQSGTKEVVYYKEAKAYVEGLNCDWFAGYRDWRLPTLEELISLLEPEKQANGLFIGLLFDSKVFYCWSLDQRPFHTVWVVSFVNGQVGWNYQSHPDSAEKVLSVHS